MVTVSHFTINDVPVWLVEAGTTALLFRDEQRAYWVAHELRAHQPDNPKLTDEWAKIPY